MIVRRPRGRGRLDPDLLRAQRDGRRPAGRERARRRNAHGAEPAHIDADDAALVREHGTGEQVAVADEVGDESRPRETVDARRLVDLLDASLVHDGDPVRQRERLRLVVRHVDERDADLLLQVDELDLHLLAQLRVEGGQRLVQQQHGRMGDERPGDRDALFLAAGELVRIALAEARRGARPRAPPRPWRGSRAKACSPSRAGTRRCLRPSCAETARSSGTPCARAAPRAGGRRGRCHRAGSRRRREDRSRRSSAGAWSCRSRRGPAA